MEIRQAAPGDGAALIEMFKLIYRESDFLLLAPDEYQLSVEKQEKLINEYSHDNTQVLFVATERQTILGFLGGTGGKMMRNRHSIHIAMGVLSSHQGKGIGNQLLRTFIDWAVTNDFHRIELTVMEHNRKAKALYDKFGFQTEGLKRNALKINGRYINEHHIAKLI